MNLCVSVSAHFGGRLWMPPFPSPPIPPAHTREGMRTSSSNMLLRKRIGTGRGEAVDHP